MYAMWTHGSSFFPANPGPDFLRNKRVGERPPLSDLHWTDQQGFRDGRGAEFRGRPHTRNWFTASIPTPVLVELTAGDTIRTNVARVMVLGGTTSGAVVEIVQVWDGTRLAGAWGADGASLGLQGDFSNLGGNNTFTFTPPPNVRFGLAVSVRVAFGEDDGSQPDNTNRVFFRSAGADFDLIRD